MSFSTFPTKNKKYWNPEARAPSRRGSTRIWMSFRDSARVQRTMEELSPTEKARCGSELKETRRELAKVKKERDEFRLQLEAVTRERDGTMTELKTANDKLVAQRAELDGVTRERDGTMTELKTANDKLVAQRAELDVAKRGLDRTKEEPQISKDLIDVQRAELDAVTCERKTKRGREENEGNRHSSGLFHWLGFGCRNRGTGGEERGREGASQT